MSKAFAGNDGEADDIDVKQAPVLPPGARNYILPSGFAALERARQAAITEKASLAKGKVEDATRLKRLEQRIEYLTDRLNTAFIVDPDAQPEDRVLFGAFVTVKNTRGEEQTWRIVGVDETDLDQGWISWISPLAKALLEKKRNDVAVFGQERLVILRMDYRKTGSGGGSSSV